MTQASSVPVDNMIGRQSCTVTEISVDTSNLPVRSTDVIKWPEPSPESLQQGFFTFVQEGLKI